MVKQLLHQVIIEERVLKTTESATHLSEPVHDNYISNLANTPNSPLIDPNMIQISRLITLN